MIDTPSNEERLMEQFVTHAHSQPKGFPVSEFINIMSEVLSSIPKARQPMEIRLLKEGSEYDVIAIQKHDSNDDEKR